MILCLKQTKNSHLRMCSFLTQQSVRFRYIVGDHNYSLVLINAYLRFLNMYVFHKHVNQELNLGFIFSACQKNKPEVILKFSLLMCKWDEIHLTNLQWGLKEAHILVRGLLRNRADRMNICIYILKLFIKSAYVKVVTTVVSYLRGWESNSWLV